MSYRSTIAIRAILLAGAAGIASPTRAALDPPPAEAAAPA
jgi:hypothetical protein